jgi:imidazolonepropionase-like amidohydrolase
MNHNLTVLLTVLCIAPGAPAAGQPKPSPSEYPPIYITHVTVVDTGTGKEARDQTVVIRSDRISMIGRGKSVKPRPDARVVDGTGKYLIPGLWDMHVHAVFPERLDSMLPMSSPTAC